MHNVQQEIASTKNFFKNAQIPLSDEWLESCINWYKEELNGTPYDEKQLHSAVYNQWLVFDLREVEVPQLPPSVQDVTKLVLNKNLVLQLLSVVDISKPKLQQLNKIKNSNPLTRGIDEENSTNNAYDNFTAKRMLQLTLTDGVQEIKAIEYKPIPSLNLNLSPGVKIKIIGPVTIRRGTMMLESHHFKLLGGEVEDLLVSNAVENVLARFLNLPENPNPRTINESMNEIQILNLDNPRQNVNLSNNIVNKNPIQSNISNYFANKNESTISKTVLKQDYKKQTFNVNDFVDDDEELLIAEKLDALLEVEASNISTPKETKLKSSNKSVFDKEELRVTQEIDMLLEAERDILAENTMQLTARKVKRLKSNSPDVFDDSNEIKGNKSTTLLASDIIDFKDDFFSGLEMGDQDEEEQKIYTLTEVKQIIGSKRSGSYTTFAKFKSVVQKLTVDIGGWGLCIAIESESDDMTVTVHSAVITEMIGYSPEDMTKMKSDIQKRNAETAELIMKAIDGFRLKLLELNCLIEIEYKGGENIPCIVRLL